MPDVDIQKNRNRDRGLVTQWSGWKKSLEKAYEKNQHLWNSEQVVQNEKIKTTLFY